VPSHGIARNLVYAVMAEEAGKPCTSATPTPRSRGRGGTPPALRDRVLQPGLEISSAHITEEAAAIWPTWPTSPRQPFPVRCLPHSLQPSGRREADRHALDDANLQHVEGITAEELRQEHRAKGVPESLVEVLHLAALADVRLLVFDADAPILQALTVYGDE